MLMNSVKSDKLRAKELTSEVVHEHGITAELLGKLAEAKDILRRRRIEGAPAGKPAANAAKR